MLSILQLSDLHFGSAYIPRVGQAALDAAQEIDADAIVVSGDLTQRAKPREFQEAAAFLDQLPDVPRLIVPGNHDVPLYRIIERLTDPYKHYRAIISDDLDPVIQLSGCVLVGMNSTSPRRAITNGRLHMDQLDHCSRVLSEVPEDWVRIVVAHHHFAPAPDYLHDQTMPKARRAMERFVELGVEMILGGHLHRAYIGNSLDFYPGHNRQHGVIIVQSGTTTSRRGRGREREKNSFNLIQIDDATISVTHYMFFDEANQFFPFSRHLFPRAGRVLQPNASRPTGYSSVEAGPTG